MADCLAIELDNDLTEILRFDRLFQSFAARHALTQHFVSQVSLAFDELLTNVISYGFPEGGRHKIRITLEVAGDCFKAELVDGGAAFDPLSKAVPDLEATQEEREIGGLGIHFVRATMDDLDYRREKDQNRLVMTKRITPERRQE